MDRGAEQATVLGVAKNWTRLKRLSMLMGVGEGRSVSNPWTREIRAGAEGGPCNTIGSLADSENQFGSSYRR